MLLVANPPSVAFGSVTVGTPLALTLRLTNTEAGGEMTISALTISDSHYVHDQTFPILLLEDEFVDITLTFTPTAVVLVSATLTVEFDGINAPQIVNLTGTGIAAGSKLIISDPTSWEFPSTKVGVPTTEKIFTLTNTGTVDTSITVLDYTTPFSAGGTQPALAYNLVAGASVDVGVIFTPVGGGYVTVPHGLRVTSDATTVNLDIPMTGIGIALTPAYSLNGTDDLSLASFSETVKKFDSNDLNCEETCSATRMTNVEEPCVEKTFHSIFVLFEKVKAGVSSNLTVEVTTLNQYKVDGISIPTGALDAKIQTGIVTLIVDGEQVEIIFSRVADQGPISILEYQVKWLPFGQLLGTSANPGTLASPAFSLTGVLGWLAGFSNFSVKQFAPGQACEEICSTDKLVNLAMPAATIQDYVDVPKEKTLYNCQVDYEDVGVVTLAVSATTRRGQTSTQSLVLGTVGANGDILKNIANLDISDEVMHLILSIAAEGGPLSLCGYNAEYEVAGEVSK